MKRSSFLKMALGAAVAPKVGAPPEMFRVVFAAAYKPVDVSGFVRHIDMSAPRWMLKNGTFEKVGS